jgi:predicted MFS family arabinose efflux permease
VVLSRIKNMMHTQVQLPMRGALAWRVFLCFAFAYFLSYAFRAVNAVIAPELIADLNISHSELGLLSSAYFVGFALMQIPIGIALDHFGPRLTESALLLIALVGSAIFAYADSLWGLTLGRLLIGIGVSACLMAAFTAYRRWFAVEQQSQLASGMLVFGTAGALATTIPVQLALPYIGWRGSFFIMAILVGLAFIGIRLGIPKLDNQPTAKNENINDEQSFGLKDILIHPFFLRMLPIGIVNHGGFLALQTLWLGPWMIDVLGYSSETSATVLFLFNGMMLLGYAFNAWMLPRANSRGFNTLNYVKWLLAVGLVSQLLGIYFSTPLSWILWIILAVSATGHILGQSTVITAFPSRNAGVAATSYNLLIFIGAFIFQWGIGWGIDLATSLGIEKVDAFKQVFFIFLALQFFSYLWFLFYPKPLKHYLAGL